MIKFSIVTPSYNQGEFIAQTIESVLSQQGDFSIEYFVMDGGSKDQTVEVIKKYEQQIKTGAFPLRCKGVEFFWISEKDEGQSDAINKGLRRASGDVVAYINSDDYYEQGAFQCVAAVLQQSKEIDWVFGKCRNVDERGHEIRKAVAWYKDVWTRQYTFNKLLVLNFVAQPSVFLRRSLVQEVGEFSKAHHLIMDYEYWLRVGLAHKARFIDERLANFRIHSSSKSSMQFKKQFVLEYEEAKKYTKSPLLRALHLVHSRAVILAYSILNVLA